MKIHKIAEVSMGYAPPVRKWDDPPISAMESIQIVNLKNISRGKIVGKCESIVSPKQLDRYLLEKDDILFCTRGTDIGSVLIEESAGLIVVAPLVRIRLKAKKVLPAYLHIFFQTAQGLAQLKKSMYSSSISMLTIKELRDFELEILPLERQRKVIALWEAHTKMLSLIEEMKKTHIKLVTQTLEQMIGD